MITPSHPYEVLPEHSINISTKPKWAHLDCQVIWSALWYELEIGAENLGLLPELSWSSMVKINNRLIILFNYLWRDGRVSLVMLWSWFSPSVVLSNNADPWSRSIAYVQIFCQQISSDIQVVVHSASFAWLILQLSPYLTNNGLKINK